MWWDEEEGLYKEEADSALICFPPTRSAGELRRRLRLSSPLDFQLTLLLLAVQ